MTETKPTTTEIQAAITAGFLQVLEAEQARKNDKKRPHWKRFAQATREPAGRRF